MLDVAVDVPGVARFVCVFEDDSFFFRHGR
jgi:hypothetical protein